VAAVPGDLGAGGPDGRKASKRLAALARAVFYSLVTVSILAYAIGLGAPSSSDKQSKDLTATVLHYPGGQVIVVLAGLGFIAGGCYLACRAWRKKFLRHLLMGSVPPRVVERLGQVGGIARGAVFATAGVFLVVAGDAGPPARGQGRRLGAACPVPDAAGPVAAGGRRGRPGPVRRLLLVRGPLARGLILLAPPIPARRRGSPPSAAGGSLGLDRPAARRAATWRRPPCIRGRTPS
jgi:hypothetical protein